MPFFSPQLENTIRLANYWYQDSSPFDPEVSLLSHVASVATILSKANQSDLVLAAGWGHELLESSDCPLPVIQEVCGEPVLSIIQTLTPDPRFDPRTQWQARGEAFIQSLKKATEETKLVCTADRIHTLHMLLTSLEEYGLPFFSTFGINAEQYLWFEDQVCLTLQTSWNHPLIPDYDQLLDKLVELLEVLDQEEKQGVYRQPLPVESDLEEPKPEWTNSMAQSLHGPLIDEYETHDSWSDEVIISKMESLKPQLLERIQHVETQKKKSPKRTATSLSTAAKYLSIEEYHLLLPAAIGLGLEHNGLTARLIQDTLKISFDQAYRMMRELKRLHVISKVDGIKPRKLNRLKAKEVLRVIKKSEEMRLSVELSSERNQS